jgi:cytochrome b
MTTPQKQAGLVWDMPVRAFHWSLVLCFAGAWLTAESEVWKLWHVSFGYSMALLIGFRLFWGVMGTRYARFAQFVKGPMAIKDYLMSYVRKQPMHYVGHNPAGALAILAIMLTAIVTVASGYASYEDVGGEWLEEIHEGAANLLILIVIIHVTAVLLTSFIQKENLVRAMITGKKWVAAGEAISTAWYSVALLLLLALAGLWWLMFR